MKNILLAVLGRGCMMQYAGGPWAATRDLDIWKLGVMRPDVLTEQNDDDPNSVIGGGELQLAAASVLYAELDPTLTVFAYGNRSPYLLEHGYPTESSVVSGLFRKIMLKETGKEPRVDIFNEEAWNVKGSSSYQEVHNMLTLGKTMSVDEVIFLTVLVHMNRVLVMVAKHLRDNPDFAALRNKVRFEVTESVLLPVPTQSTTANASSKSSAPNHSSATWSGSSTARERCTKGSFKPSSSRPARRVNHQRGW